MGVRLRLHKTSPGGVYPVTVRRLRTASARACRRLRWTRTALLRRLLLTEAVPGAGVAGPVPLCCGGEPEAAVWLASRDASHAPCAPRLSGVLGGASADWCNVPESPVPAAHGRGVVHPTQSVTIPDPTLWIYSAYRALRARRAKK